MHDVAATPFLDAAIEDLLGLIARARAGAERDPFGNPVLSVALAISRRIDDGALDERSVRAIIGALADQAFRDRAARLAAYVGETDPTVFDRLAARLIRPDPADSPVPWAAFTAAVSRPRFAAVFTAHPTFAMPFATAALLSRAAHDPKARRMMPPSHRPGPITLEEEFAQAAGAIAHARDAIDAFVAALLRAARATWPDRWTRLDPAPLLAASWVGYDTDGRTDIGWADMIRFRLRMKAMGLARLASRAPAGPLADRLATALAETDRQHALCPAGSAAEPEAVQRFARALIEGKARALTDIAELRALFDDAIAGTEDEEARLALVVARASLVSHGLSLAHTHVRLNAQQVHNALRHRLGFDASPEDRARRRGLIAAINAALDVVEPIPVDFGAILAEQSSATRLMMTVAQILKHIDGSQPIRFLIAETETGYTLLAALWLARRFGVADRLEISPLFETADGLEHGARVLEEALRSPHFRDHLRRAGRLCLQFGYSDSGRFVGQLAASYLVERLRLKLAETLTRFDLGGLELVLFNTHGESIGRGAHPGTLADRLEYLAPAQSRARFAEAKLAVREEASFQGSEGYLLFGTPELATATVARLAEHAFSTPLAEDDPIYQEADFAAEFFGSLRAAMESLTEDPGYAALLGAFGPALLDPTGSRPAKRQSDGLDGPAVISHPRELRAIPNNAILHQLGFLANTLHGLGQAIARAPETFAELVQKSPRFGRAMAMAAAARTKGDIDILRGYVATLDPGTWLDRAQRSTRSGRREELIAVADALEALGFAAPVRRLFRRLQRDGLLLDAVWPGPQGSDRLFALHALRIAAIHRIWLLAARIPDFSPRHGVTRAGLMARLLRLDVTAALDILEEVFPRRPDPAASMDFGEPAGPRAATTYEREHEELFAPMRAWFALVREGSAAIAHEVGSFG